MNLSIPSLIGGFIFSTIGFSAFIYGKKQTDIKAMILGVLLMGYPYFVGNTIAVYFIGVVLTAGLFL